MRVQVVETLANICGGRLESEHPPGGKDASSISGTVPFCVRTVKDHPELMDFLQTAMKDLTKLWERYHKDNPDNKTSVPKDVKPDGGMAKFDRLPRLELPSFNGENSAWRPYWEKFNNFLKKDPTLTDVM